MGLFKKKKEKKDKNHNRFLEYDKKSKPKINHQKDYLITKKEYDQEEKDDYYKELIKRRKDTDYIAENLDKHDLKYENYLAENLNNTIAYSEYIAENLNKSTEYDYINDEKIPLEDGVNLTKEEVKELIEKFKKHYKKTNKGLKKTVNSDTGKTYNTFSYYINMNSLLE